MKYGVYWGEKRVVKNLKVLAAEIKEHGMASGESSLHKFPPFPLARITDIEYAMLKVIIDRAGTAGSGEDGCVNSIKELKEMLDLEQGYTTPRSNVKYYLL